MNFRSDDRTAVTIAGCFTQGQPIDDTYKGQVEIPTDWIAEDEFLLRIAGRHLTAFNIRERDIVTIEKRPRRQANKGELIMAKHAGRMYIGRFWRLAGRRTLLDADGNAIVAGSRFQIIGAVTFVTRVHWR